MEFPDKIKSSEIFLLDSQHFPLHELSSLFTYQPSYEREYIKEWEDGKYGGDQRLVLEWNHRWISGGFGLGTGLSRGRSRFEREGTFFYRRA